MNSWQEYPPLQDWKWARLFDMTYLQSWAQWMSTMVAVFLRPLLPLNKSHVFKITPRATEFIIFLDPLKSLPQLVNELYGSIPEALVPSMRLSNIRTVLSEHPIASWYGATGFTDKAVTARWHVIMTSWKEKKERKKQQQRLYLQLLLHNIYISDRSALTSLHWALLHFSFMRKSNHRTVPSSPQLRNEWGSLGMVITSYVVPEWQLNWL